MKKGFLAIFTVLTVFALVMTGCPSPGTPTPKPPKLYTVTFDGNENTGGTVPAPITQKTEGASIKLPTKGSGSKTLVKTGFTFGGWSVDVDVDDDDDILAANDSYTPEEDVTLYAVWTSNSSGPLATVTFDGNGKTSGDVPATITNKKVGDTITLPGVGTMVKTGNAFGGWSKSGAAPALSSPWLIDAETVTLKAIWSPVFTITFDLGGGGGTVPSPLTQESGGAGIALPPIGQMTGPTAPVAKPNFAGWATVTGAEPNASTVVASPYTPTTNTTLYAVWSAEAVKYKVTFNANGGSGPQADIEQATAGADITLPAVTFTPPAYKTFDGWSTSTASTGKITGTTYKPTQLTVLYALWKGTAATVTFDGNGATVGVPAAITGKETGDSIDLPLVGSMTNGTKTFGGWSVSGEGTALTSPWVITAASVTLKAIWTDGSVPKPPLSEHFEETVKLINGNLAAYYFVLPSGKTFADYDGIEADFKVDHATFEAENRVRGGPRLYGNYPLNYLKLVEVTEENPLTDKFFGASLGSGEGEWNNGNLILDNGFLGSGWGPISSGTDDKGQPNGLYDKMQAAGIPEDKLPQEDAWFTVPYWTDATKAHGDYNKLNGGFDGTAQAGLRNPTGSGPFIFGLGLTGNGTPTTAQVRDVRLVGKTAGTGDVLGKPLYIKDSGVEYPAFVSYTSASGNGVAGIKRTHVSGEKAVLDKPAAPVLPEYTVTFNLNKPTAASGTPVFATPADFTGSVSIKQGYNVAVAPTATLTDYNFKGWVETITGTAPIAGVETKKVYAAKTLYACWKLASEDTPNATVDKEITTLVQTSHFGNDTYAKPAGLGPFAFKVADANQGVIWFALTDDVTTAVYASVEVKYTAVEIIAAGGTTSGKPRKMKFTNGRADNAWNGGTDDYRDVADDTEQTFTFSINDLTKSAGIQIGHNKSDASCDFNFTITKITLIKP